MRGFGSDNNLPQAEGMFPPACRLGVSMEVFRKIVKAGVTFVTLSDNKKYIPVNLCAIRFLSSCHWDVSFQIENIFCENRIHYDYIVFYDMLYFL